MVVSGNSLLLDLVRKQILEENQTTDQAELFQGRNFRFNASVINSKVGIFIRFQLWGIG